MLITDKDELRKLIKKEGNVIDFEYNSYRCKIKRNKAFGHLCGYVKIPITSCMYGVTYDDKVLGDIEVHSGLTFAWHLDDTKDWWLGFSCDHTTDLLPKTFYESKSIFELINKHYRTVDFVRNQLIKLVDQLIAKESELLIYDKTRQIIKSGALVVYDPGYKVVFGKVKRLSNDGTKAFVWYHTGDTAACTKIRNLYPVSERFALEYKKLFSNSYAVEEIIKKEIKEKLNENSKSCYRQF